MAELIEMPLMSDTMTEGRIVSWLKKVGDTVSAGEIMAEVETDKATMELESYFDGTLLWVGADAGGSVPVGDLLAIVGSPGEDAAKIVAEYRASKGGAAPAAPVPAAAPAPSAPQAAAPAPQPVAPSPQTLPAEEARIKASPLAKAIARETGIDLSRIQGSGDAGRIVKRDLEQVLAAGPAPAAQPVPASAPVFSGESYEDVGLSQMRKTIARRLSESKYTAPHYYLTMEIDMTAAQGIRKRLNEESNVKISFNDLIIKACASALRKHPQINASWLGESIRYHHVVNIGVAVAIEGGLVVPVIRQADSKGLATIASEARELAEKARNRQLQPEDYQGNTFSISNLGMYGIHQFTAIINPPDSCILAVGGIEEVPRFVMRDGQRKIRVASIMKVTLSCDHRVVDGSVGAEFLQTVKHLLENPLRMLL